MKKKHSVKKSRIHGNGVFASCNIMAGEKILEYVGEKISKSEAYKRGLKHKENSKKTGSGAVYIFELNSKFDLDGNVEHNDARFINHACSTNCEAIIDKGKIWIIAKTDIKSGDEILYNYGYSFEHFLDHPCRCGKPECVGFIVAEADRLKLKRVLRGKSKRKIAGLVD